MNQQAYEKLKNLASTPEAIDRSVEYLAQNFCNFLKKNEQTLICFPEAADGIGSLMGQAVTRCGGVPRFIGEDRRWKTLLREAFSSRCTTLIGPPLLILGLAKLARAMGTPLSIRNVVLAGYPTMDWMAESIQRGFDCRIWGCFDPGTGPVIAGFSCSHGKGVHLRSEEYLVDIVDSQDCVLPVNQVGNIVLYPIDAPKIRVSMNDIGRLDTTPCPCGCPNPRIMDLNVDETMDPSLNELGEMLHSWSSILDCRMAKTEYGLELELVVFSGEKLPKLPNCAKLVIRPWDPETETPFDHTVVLKNRYFSGINH